MVRRILLWWFKVKHAHGGAWRQVSQRMTGIVLVVRVLFDQVLNPTHFIVIIYHSAGTYHEFLFLYGSISARNISYQ